MPDHISNRLKHLTFTANSRSAYFARVKPEHDAAKVVEHLTNELKYPAPRLLISVTGGAQGFVLPPRLEPVLKRGLRTAAEATQAWVVTGGTATGIMKYVGQAMVCPPSCASCDCRSRHNRTSFISPRGRRRAFP